MSITPEVIAEIRARHEADRKDTRFERLDNQAHADRATLLRRHAQDQEEIVRLREALRLFMGAAHPVSTEIDPRGYRWSLAYLDQARAALKDNSHD